MKIRPDQFSAASQNPVLHVDKDGTVIYSNEAGKILLNEWSVTVGEILPSGLGDLAQKVIFRNSPEKTEVIVGKKVFLVVFHPLSEEKLVCISGFDISDQQASRDKVQEYEVQEIVDIDLAEIIDAQAIQSLMDDFYKLAHIPMSIDNLRGKVLVGVGWQDICTKFHRVNPETCKNCLESSTIKSDGVLNDEFKLYRCKNNMWHIMTPIMVGGRHLGNIISGQFFFDEEPFNSEFFRSQAGKYGFNEEEYLAAVKKVPRLSRAAVDASMSFFIKFASLISQLGCSNIKLAQSLSELDTLVEALRKSEKIERTRSDELAVVLDAAPAFVLITHDPRALIITGNRLSYEWLRLPRGANLSKAAPEGERAETYKLFKNGVEIPLEDMPARIAASGKDVRDYEFDIVYSDGTMRHLLGNARPLRNEQGNPRGSVTAFIDITERKRAEKALQESETHFRALAENSPDIITRFDRQCRHVYANPAAVKSYGIPLDEIIGKTQGELGRSHEKVKFWEEHLENTFATGKTETLEYHFLSLQGEKYYFNTKIVPEFLDGRVISVLAISRDITNIKEAAAKLKETLDNLESLVKARTSELEIAYNSLKEIKESLAEAQRIAHIGSWELDIATGKAFWSEEMYRIFRFNPQEIAPSFNEFLYHIHPDDRDCVDKIIKKWSEGFSDGIDCRIIPANGEERTVYIQAESIFDEEKIPIRVKGIVQDITERKKSEKEIRILASIVESSNDAIITKSLDGIITTWNEGANQIYGYSAKEVLGKHISILAPSNLDEETKKLTELIKQGESVHHYETSRLRKDGKLIDVSLNLSPVFDTSARLIAVSVIARDITERRAVEEKLCESEEKYRNIVETANEGILVIDNEATITYTNKKLAEMLGYSRGEGIGRPIWDFLSEESRVFVKLNLGKRWLDIDDSYELKLVRKDGSALWALISAKSLFDKDGKFMGSICMLTDVTRRKEAEQVLANFELARKKEIHHRIKNNLQIVSSLLDLQVNKFKDRKDIKDTEIVDALIESQNRVISMALIHEELYRGGGFETINFSAYIDELTDKLLLTYRLGNTDIKLNKDLEGDFFLDLDTAIPLGIIINELISNSLKYAFSGRNKGEIRIGLHREEQVDFINNRKENKFEDSKSTNFVLSVSDNGVGIPENFDIENSDSLGLRLVTSLVEQLDGELKVKRNNGTEFTIKFAVNEKSKKVSAPAPNNYSPYTDKVRL